MTQYAATERIGTINALAREVREQKIDLNHDSIIAMLREATAQMTEIECEIGSEATSDTTGGKWTNVRVYLKGEPVPLFKLRIARKLSVGETMLPLGAISSLTADEYYNLIEINLKRRLGASADEKEKLMTRIEEVLGDQKRFNPKTGEELSYNGLRSKFDEPYSFSQLTGRPMSEKITGCTVIINPATEERLVVPFDEAKLLMETLSSPWQVILV